MAPVVPGKKDTGTNTAESTSAVATTTPDTCCMPREVASRASTLSCSITRSTFSMTTMASSTTRPVASVRPKSVSVLSEKPNALTNMNVPSSDTGSVVTATSTLRQPCRKMKMTRTTRRMASPRALSTSSMEALTALVVSKATLYVRPGGKLADSRFSSFSTPSRTSSALEPGSWVMPRPTASWPLKRKSCW
ncbi:hypothetical protein COSO111634_35830 [Corallococcus soli]